MGKFKDMQIEMDNNLSSKRRCENCGECERDDFLLKFCNRCQDLREILFRKGYISEKGKERYCPECRINNDLFNTSYCFPCHAQIEHWRED